MHVKREIALQTRRTHHLLTLAQNARTNDGQLFQCGKSLACPAVLGCKYDPRLLIEAPHPYPWITAPMCALQGRCYSGPEVEVMVIYYTAPIKSEYGG